MCVVDGELDLVLFRNILPELQEVALVHLTILVEVHVKRHDDCEVEDVHIILHSHLKVTSVPFRINMRN